MNQNPKAITNQSQLHKRSSSRFVEEKDNEETRINRLVTEHQIPRETAKLMVHPPEGAETGFKCERLG